eukprot:CAMPEP_0168611730 /NCGR_PEP_ID=MMETSP0449_2-20121227/2517_1 /TAXON_ID=1082188 /ORGANISM="Strombidium rassoulzadegani, Strain ras09" /LENGTH=75 /DNA_ID=CAMNT_0008652203 /DNA_START=1080 /DNA_END=1307 /DNA_ORIENTATION=-
MNSKQCHLEGCSKEFLKSAGAYIHGLWFCSDAHVDQDKKAQELIRMLDKPERRCEGGKEVEELERQQFEEHMREI